MSDSALSALFKLTISLPHCTPVMSGLARTVRPGTDSAAVGVADEAICRALASFQGIDRRLQFIGEARIDGGTVSIVDDYGHHPTEVAATLEALRQAWPGRRLVLVFQPHRYTRTRDLLDDFANVLATVDVLLVTEVYAAGEAPIKGADGRSICRAVRSRGKVEPVFVDQLNHVAAALKGVLRADDVVVTMGAGHIGAIAQELPSQLARGGI